MPESSILEIIHYDQVGNRTVQEKSQIVQGSSQWITWAGIVLLLLIDGALRHTVGVIVPNVPSPLIGMALCVGSLVSLRYTGHEDFEKKVRRFLQPAVEFITHRYLVLFYSPALVSLPLAVSKVEKAEDIVLSVLVVAIGCFLTTIVTAHLVVLIRKYTAASAAVPFSVISPNITFDKSLVRIWVAILTISLLGVLWIELQGSNSMNGDGGLLLHSILILLLYLASTVVGYVLGMQYLPKKLRKWLHPMIVCALMPNIVAVSLGGLTWDGYTLWITRYMPKQHGQTAGQHFLGGVTVSAGSLLFSMLGPIILSFGLKIAEHWDTLVRHRNEIFGACACSALWTMVSTAFLAGRIFNISSDVARALVPRGSTLALALPIANKLGASVQITAAAVALTGLIGGNFVQYLLTMLKLEDVIARGVTAAAVGHGLGCSAIGSNEQDALPFAALSYVLCGVYATIFSLFGFFVDFIIGITG
jgi:putative effector of murein hydrolase